MHYLFFSSLFFLSIFIVLGSFTLFVFKRSLFNKIRSKLLLFLSIWFTPYFIFVFFFTGPKDLSEYPAPTSSPYKLPWKAGVSRLVAQGNNSFTTHRNLHYYAWDFMMANGTPVLAARGGVVDEVVQSFDGIGFNSNYVHIKHDDGTYGGYAHIRKNNSHVKVGEEISQGQLIALSGMVGETIMPHLHFYVLNQDKTVSLPISFQDVSGGVPLAGRFYTSNNSALKNKHISSLHNQISVFSDQPEIQCTILEITKKKALFGTNLEQYDSISNDAIKSKLTIANKPISLKPRLLEKTDNFEKIEISKDDQRLIRKIHGKPISRNGSLELNGEKIAKITCH